MKARLDDFEFTAHKNLNANGPSAFYRGRPQGLPSIGWVLAMVMTILTMPAVAGAQVEEGIYQTAGYGYIFQFGPDTDSPRQAAAYQTTESSLLPGFPVELKSDDELLLNGSNNARWLNNNGIQLQLADQTLMDLRQIDDLPRPSISGPTTDPEATFQVAWELVEQYCSLFPVVQLDWKQWYQELKPRVTPETTDEELFQLLAEMLKPLNDGHTTLLSEDLDLEYSPGPSFHTAWVDNRIADIFKVIGQRTDSGLTSLNEYEGLPLAGVAFGSIGDLGYLAVNMMLVLGVDESEAGPIFEAAIDTALSSLADKKGLILDLRLNPGGSDRFSVALAKRFTDRARLGYQKMARIGDYDQFASPTEIHYAPAGVRWGQRPVALLTSRETASAAEIATIMLGDLPNVTVIGEPTYGALSNSYPYVLPNGWQLSLSTELYLNAQGINYEQKGYPVDQTVVWNESALNLDRDNVLEQAIAFLESKEPSSCTPSRSTLCLQNGRFALQAEWRDFAGLEGTAQTVSAGPEVGSFSFFSDNNVELVVKVLDGRSINDAFWVFVGSLSNVAFKITVTDTETGAVKVYENSAGSFASFGDVTAFPVAP